MKVGEHRVHAAEVVPGADEEIGPAAERTGARGGFDGADAGVNNYSLTDTTITRTFVTSSLGSVKVTFMWLRADLSATVPL